MTQNTILFQSLSRILHVTISNLKLLRLILFFKLSRDEESFEKNEKL